MQCDLPTTMTFTFDLWPPAPPLTPEVHHDCIQIHEPHQQPLRSPAYHNIHALLLNRPGRRKPQHQPQHADDDDVRPHDVIDGDDRKWSDVSEVGAAGSRGRDRVYGGRWCCVMFVKILEKTYYIIVVLYLYVINKEWLIRNNALIN